MNYVFVGLVINNNCASFYDQDNNSQISIPEQNVHSRLMGDSFYEISRAELQKAKDAFDALKIQPLPEGIYTSEIDPNGLDQHEHGAKLDSGKNRLGLVLLAFSNALQEVGVVGTFGAKKYTDNGWLTVQDGKIRYTDAMLRHLLQEKTEGKIDKETGLRHSAQVAWNALARLQLQLMEEDNG